MKQRIEVDLVGNIVSSKGLKNVGTAKEPNYVLNFRMASNHFSGEEASFVNVAAWDRNAINLASNLRPGKPLRVVGTLELRQFASTKHFLRDGSPAMLTSADVRMERFDYIDSQRPAAQASEQAAGTGEDAGAGEQPAQPTQPAVQAVASGGGKTRRRTSKSSKKAPEAPAAVLGERVDTDLTQTQDEF